VKLNSTYLADFDARDDEHFCFVCPRSLTLGCVLSSNFPFATEFKEIRKEWKARKKEEEAQRKAAEERERAAAAQAAQANQVDAPGPTDPAQAQPPAYAGGVRPQLPPIGYQPADGQVPGQYGGAGGIVYQGNGQMAYPPNYPHSPYGQSGQVYQQRK
jgi:hypothetical protein